MKIETAKQVVDMMAQIEASEKKLLLLEKTKEFCQIKIEGEDGNERKHQFFIHHQSNENIIEFIRES